MGTAPFSEPETQAIRDFVNSQPRMTTMLSLHTFSELVLYPWGYSNDAIGDKAGNKADLPVFEKMARTMAGWNKYTPQQSSDLYIASGDTTDWAYGQHGIFAFTFELDPTNMFEGGFYPSPTVTDAVFAKNLRPFLYLLEFADNPHRTLTQPTPSFLMTPAKAGVAMASFGDVQL
jgi:carboxypeptidase T